MKLREVLLVLLAGFSCANGDSVLPTGKPLLSSDRIFEEISTPESSTLDVNGKPYYYGERVFVRRAGSNEPGVLLRENDRWMVLKWEPHSHLIAVEDNWDGHSSGVYVYAISLEAKSQRIQYRLVFKSPGNTYGVRWTFEGWGSHPRTLHLSCSVDRNDLDYFSKISEFPRNIDAYPLRRTFTIGTRALVEKD